MIHQKSQKLLNFLILLNNHQQQLNIYHRVKRLDNKPNQIKKNLL